MAVNYKEIAEGAVVSAASVSDSFQSIRTEVNDLDETAIEKNTLTRNHLPSPVLAAATTGRSGSDLMRSSLFDMYPGWNTVGGWRQTGLEASFTAVDLGREKTAGILVLANINVKNITAKSTSSGTQYWHPHYMAAFAIQYRSGGTWTHLARTERYVDMDTGDDDNFTSYAVSSTTTNYETQIIGKDVAIRTFIKESDNSSGMTIDKVRLVFVPHQPGSSSSTTSEITVRQGNISAITIQGEEIS